MREAGSGARETDTYRLEDLAWMDCCLTFGVNVPEVDLTSLEGALMHLLERQDASSPRH